MEKFNLIDGIFNAKDAKEILLTLIEQKIKFHELKNFSCEIRTGIKDVNSLLKINELNITKAKINEVLKSNNQDEISFSIKAEIMVTQIVVETTK